MIIRRLFAFGLLACASAVFAQTERGSIAGTIQDSSGAVIPAAKVTVTNATTNVASTLTSTGTCDYSAVSLPPGVYAITVDTEGCKHFVRSGVILPPSGNIRVGVNLEVGTSQTTG